MSVIGNFRHSEFEMTAVHVRRNILQKLGNKALDRSPEKKEGPVSGNISWDV